MENLMNKRFVYVPAHCVVLMVKEREDVLKTYRLIFEGILSLELRDVLNGDTIDDYLLGLLRDSKEISFSFYDITDISKDEYRYIKEQAGKNIKLYAVKKRGLKKIGKFKYRILEERRERKDLLDDDNSMESNLVNRTENLSDE